MYFFIEAPNSAHTLIQGRLIRNADIQTNITAMSIFSSLGKNAVPAIVAIVQAFGFTHWNKEAS